MALQIRNLPGRPGYAQLIFDRLIDAEHLTVSIFNRINHQYLGASVPGKANWTVARSHYFTAMRVVTAESGTSFQVGPEVTTYIPDETILEIASSDDTIREQAVWQGILLDYGWSGVVPDPEPAAKPVPPPLPTPMPSYGGGWVAAAPPSPPPKSVAALPPPEIVAKPVEPSSRPPLSDPANGLRPIAYNTRSGTLILQIISWSVLVILLASAYLNSDNGRVRLCEMVGRGCSTEQVVFNAAQQCSAAKGCEAATCTADYRRLYPTGRFLTKLADIEREKGGRCIDPERDVFDAAAACAAGKTCGSLSCLAEYRSKYPTGRFTSDVSEIERISGGSCRPDPERSMFERARTCAADRESTLQPCSVSTCYQAFNASYPNNPRMASERSRIQQANQACRAQQQREQEAARNGGLAPLPPLPPLPPLDPPVLSEIVPRTNQRPSFDCAKAVKPVEQMICRDQEIAREDSWLSVAYRAKLDRAGGGDLRAEERDWIARRDRDCGVPDSGPWTDMDLRRVKSCLIDKTRARRLELDRL